MIQAGAVNRAAYRVTPRISLTPETPSGNKLGDIQCLVVLYVGLRPPGAVGLHLAETMPIIGFSLLRK